MLGSFYIFFVFYNLSFNGSWIVYCFFERIGFVLSFRFCLGVVFVCIVFFLLLIVCKVFIYFLRFSILFWFFDSILFEYLGRVFGYLGYDLSFGWGGFFVFGRWEVEFWYKFIGFVVVLIKKCVSIIREYFWFCFCFWFGFWGRKWCFFIYCRYWCGLV